MHMWTNWTMLLGTLVGCALFGRPRRLVADPAAPEVGPLRIVVPARNEEASIGNLLGDLAATARPEWDVVVVDDGSSDATASIAARFPVARVVTAPAPPAGWRGKPWACWLGADLDAPDGGPSPSELVFLDADVRLAPGAVEALVTGRRAAGGVLSVQPHHVAPTATEELSAVFNLVSLMGVGAATDRPRGMFGPVIACARRDYERVGGHRAVRRAVAEDLELAQRFRDAGVPVRIETGDRAVRFRMYPTGLAALVEGWSKNMATGAAAVSPWRTLGVAWWVSGLVTAAIAGVTFAASPSWSELGAYTLAVVTLRYLLTQVGTFRWWVALAFPVPLGVFVAVFARSAYLTLVRREVTWRGRALDLRTDRRASTEAS